MAIGTVNSNSLNLWVAREPAFSGAVKRKWRKRLEDRVSAWSWCPPWSRKGGRNPFHAWELTISLAENDLNQVLRMKRAMERPNWKNLWTIL